MRFSPSSPDDRQVIVTEVGTRDGFQAEHNFIPTDIKVGVIDALIDAGVRAFEATSFVSPRAIPQLADAAEVMARIQRKPGVRLAALVPNARGAERAAAAKVDAMVCFVSASESHCQTNLNKSIAKALADVEEFMPIARQFNVPVSGAIATAFGCPFEGEVPVSSLLRVAESYHRSGIRHLTLGDTTGMATPPVIERAVEGLRENFPDMHLSLHFHNTRGVGLANVMAGLAMGVREFESSIAGLGGCPFAPGATGNICTEDLVYLLHECGYETGIDLDKLCAVAREVETIVGRALPGQVMKSGARLKRMSLDSARRAVG